MMRAVSCQKTSMSESALEKKTYFRRYVLTMLCTLYFLFFSRVCWTGAGAGKLNFGRSHSHVKTCSSLTFIAPRFFLRTPPHPTHPLQHSSPLPAPYVNPRVESVSSIAQYSLMHLNSVLRSSTHHQVFFRRINALEILSSL